MLRSDNFDTTHEMKQIRSIKKQTKQILLWKKMIFSEGTIESFHKAGMYFLHIKKQEFTVFKVTLPSRDWRLFVTDCLLYKTFKTIYVKGRQKPQKVNSKVVNVWQIGMPTCRKPTESEQKVTVFLTLLDLISKVSEQQSTYVCVSGCSFKICSFFGKFGMLCFHITPVLRSTLWPYYQ